MLSLPRFLLGLLVAVLLPAAANAKPPSMVVGVHVHTIVVNVAEQHATVYLFSPTHKQYVFRARFSVATGKSGFATPRGVFFIANEAKNPSWTAPYATWVPKPWRGHTIGPDDPRNPLTGTWLGLGGLPLGRSGIGFHGTKEDSSIGARASHGCLRMHAEDSNTLARIVRVGTPVVIE